MTDSGYIKGIVSIISKYRRAELGKKLDEAHVQKWIAQFEPKERTIVLQETFRILQSSYFKEELMHTYLDEIVDQIAKDRNINDIVFTAIQEKGSSQALIYNYIKTKGQFTFQSENFTDSSKLYVYIDDALFSGRRTRDDIRKLIGLLPSGAHLKVYYIIAYSDGFNYWKDTLSSEARCKEISIDFSCQKLYKNNRKSNLGSYQFFWPDKSCQRDNDISCYENKLQSTRKCYYLYCYNEKNSGLCSSPEANKKLTYIFLKYGLRIVNAVKKTEFMPLGFGYPLSFGFGAFCASDWNIPNNCPLVLWWGDIEDPQSVAGSWYPLLPRRNNNELYNEICKYEEDLSLAGNIDALKTVYNLALDEQKKRPKLRDALVTIGDFLDANPNFEKNLITPLKRYMNALDMNAIKIIQTVMYIGRDYHIEDSIEQSCRVDECNDPTLLPQNKKFDLKVEDPEFLLSVWMKDLEWAKAWEAKEIEIAQICGKILVVPKYMRRAFEILGIN